MQGFVRLFDTYSPSRLAPPHIIDVLEQNGAVDRDVAIRLPRSGHLPNRRYWSIWHVSYQISLRLRE